MKRLNVVLSGLLVITVLASVLPLGACGGPEARVQDIYISFSRAAFQGDDGQAQFTVGDQVSAVAGIPYTGSGSAKGEWILDGKKQAVSFNLPLGQDSAERSIATVRLDLPTASAGLHSIGFSLTSPTRLSTSPIEFVIREVPPPANPTSYVVQLAVGAGHATKDNEGGLNWHDELRMLVGTKVWVPQNKDVLPPIDSSLWSAVLPPNGNDFAIQDKTRANYAPGMDDFAWNKTLTPRLVVDEGKGVTFRTQLWEKDADIVGGLFKAIAFITLKIVGAAAGSTMFGGPVVPTITTSIWYKAISALIDKAGGADDYIGEDITYLSSSELGQVLAAGGQKTYKVHYDGKNHDKKKGDFELEMVLRVEQYNMPAPSGPGVYEIQEFVHDGAAVTGGDTEGGNEEIRLTRLAGSTAGGRNTYSPNGQEDINIQDDEPILWEGAVSDPVRILDDGTGSYRIDGSPIARYVSEYGLKEMDPGGKYDNFGSSSLSLSMAEIDRIATSDQGFVSSAREFSYNDNGVERTIVLNFEIRVRKEPLAYRYIVKTYVNGGKNVEGGNTEGGNEEFRLTATDANGLAVDYAPPGSKDIKMDDDGKTFTWAEQSGWNMLSSTTLAPIGGGKYVVKSVANPLPVTGYSMNWKLWEDDAPEGPNSGDEQFGAVEIALAVGKLEEIIRSGGEYTTTSRFSGAAGKVDLNFKIAVSKEVAD